MSKFDQMFYCGPHTAAGVDLDSCRVFCGFLDIQENRGNATCQDKFACSSIVLRGNDGDTGDAGAEKTLHCCTLALWRKIRGH